MQLLMQRLTLLFLLITVIVAMMTMGLSWQADNAKSEVRFLEKQIEEVKLLIKVSEGEWSQLNRPQRLKELAEIYLDIEKFSTYNQIEDVSQLPTKEEVEAFRQNKLLRQQQEAEENAAKALREKEQQLSNSFAEETILLEGYNDNHSQPAQDEITDENTILEPLSIETLLDTQPISEQADPIEDLIGRE